MQGRELTFVSQQSGAPFSTQAWRVYLATGLDFREKNRASFGSIGTRHWLKPPTSYSFSPKLNVRVKDNNNSPHGKFHRFLFPFSSKFSDLNSIFTYIMSRVTQCKPGLPLLELVTS